MGVNRLNPVQKATYFLKKSKVGKNEECTVTVKAFSSGIFINGSFITALNLTSKIVYQQYIEKLFKVPTARLYFPGNLMSVMNIGPQYTL